MSFRTDVHVGGGGSLFGAIGLVLVILKLAGVPPVAAWSWWLVTLPWTFGIAIFLLIGSIVLASIGILTLIDLIRKW